MTRIRLRPAGFDARPWRPSSLRAQAQRLFCATPLPNPPLQAGREQALPCGDEQPVLERSAVQPTALTQQVRALYEAGVVPVRELARIAGVNERTLYRMIAKGGWRRRRAGQDIASAVAKRANKRKPRPCVTAKGAGGRFIGSADVGKPVRHGLKALDPAGEGPALLAGAEAALAANEAMRRVRQLREELAQARAQLRAAATARDLAAAQEADREARAARAAARQAAAAELRQHRLALARKLAASFEDGEQPNRGPVPDAVANDSPSESEHDRRINAVAARFMRP